MAKFTKKEEAPEVKETAQTAPVSEKKANPCVCGNPKKPEFCTNCN